MPASKASQEDVMKGLLSGLLVCSGCLVSAAAAQEVRWRAATAPAAAAAPAVTLGRPVPLSGETDVPVQPAVFRAAMADPGLLRVAAETPWKPPAPVPVTAEPAFDPPPAAAGPGAWGGFAAHRTADVLPPAFGPGEPALVPSHPDGPLGLADTFGLPPCPVYARGEYLLWWIKNPRFPPLLTTSPPASAGILGNPGTVVLFGGSVDAEERSGGRFTAGVWLDCERTLALEGSVFFLGQRSINFLAGSNAFPVIGRPFFDINAGTESAQVATTPGVSVGSVSVSAPSRLFGSDLDLRQELCCRCLPCGGQARLDVLGGFRYAELDESLNITESLQALPTSPVFPGSSIRVDDHFGTRNEFFGGQAGVAAEQRWGGWSAEGLFKVALGDTHEVVNISGDQLIVMPNGMISVARAGLLALPSNSGRFTRDRFAVIPEVGVNVGYQVTDWWRVFVGYNFLYWSSVARPGQQIDRVLNTAQIPNFGSTAASTGLARPAATVPDGDFWAQGITFGMEFRY
jgi:hypothetical protein